MSHTDSILDSTKKKLGLKADYDVFDADIIDHINGVFFNLHQLGVGPVSGFAIEDDEATWDTFLPNGVLLNAVKTYVYLKVKVVFDPPGTSYNLNSTEELIKELEWRINTMREEYSEPIIIRDPDNATGIVGPIFADVDGGGASL